MEIQPIFLLFNQHAAQKSILQLNPHENMITQSNDCRTGQNVRSINGPKASSGDFAMATLNVFLWDVLLSGWHTQYNRVSISAVVLVQKNCYGVWIPHPTPTGTKFNPPPQPDKTGICHALIQRKGRAGMPIQTTKHLFWQGGLRPEKGGRNPPQRRRHRA